MSGAVGKVVMLAWCREFHTKLRFQAQVAASDRGETPLYRPRDWIGFFKMNNLELFISNIARLRNCPEVTRVNKGHQVSTRSTRSTKV